MLVDDYAKALTAVIGEGKHAGPILASLDTVLARRGHEKLKGRILRELARLLERAREGRATLMIADANDVATLKSEISAATQQLGAADTDTIIDPTLIGGFVLRTKTKQLDRSYKNALLKLYRSIITNS